MNKNLQGEYPPQVWTCPISTCGHNHSKPHFAHPGQINYKRRPSQPGRIVFNREVYSCDVPTYKSDTSVRDEYKGITGKSTVTIGDIDFPAPLFCPHCGWEDTLIYITKIPRGNWKPKKGWLLLSSEKCDVRGCKEYMRVFQESTGRKLCLPHYTQFKQWRIIVE